MKTSLAFAAVAVFTFTTASVFSHTEAAAQWVEKKVQPGPTVYTWEGKKVTRAEFYALMQAREARKLAEQRGMDRKKKMEQEIAREARAYEKMKQERQRSAPTTEHCFMKNGALVCKRI